ncbi:pulmonary surfactant-associated protein D-like [Thamnophis elegans]|uniref:pulmonary surfactant-associated protein D-like n=1 Tax=Thamnophis elegans TaxID=35005 RepID=UPI001376DBB2|nr:pulmonary surfactant-associated protein D-like [Thamnophis elegans]XP_032087443.1 pulmonary surfactant-associated protein D-like [Thamnophis elegans]XP_032087444.1 pulmonary surfactant-associated protein D-like [Thamnophis elegans]
MGIPEEKWLFKDSNSFQIHQNFWLSLHQTKINWEVGQNELELLKLQIKELRIQMDILKATFIKVQQATLAPNGMLVGDKMFKRSDSKGDFQGATGNCAHMNGKLALPRNPEENEALKKILEQRNERAILGTMYSTAEKKFKDLNGHSLQFFNWAPGEPNNPGYEKCVECTQMASGMIEFAISAGQSSVNLASNGHWVG